MDDKALEQEKLKHDISTLTDSQGLDEADNRGVRGGSDQAVKAEKIKIEQDQKKRSEDAKFVADFMHYADKTRAALDNMRALQTDMNNILDKMDAGLDKAQNIEDRLKKGIKALESNDPDQMAIILMSEYGYSEEEIDAMRENGSLAITLKDELQDDLLSYDEVMDNLEKWDKEYTDKKAEYDVEKQQAKESLKLARENSDGSPESEKEIADLEKDLHDLGKKQQKLDNRYGGLSADLRNQTAPDVFEKAFNEVRKANKINTDFGRVARDGVDLAKDEARNRTSITKYYNHVVDGAAIEEKPPEPPTPDNAEDPDPAITYSDAAAKMAF